MFDGAFNFNQPLNDWDVGGVNDMDSMFYESTKFNQCLSTWADKTPPNVSVNGIFEKSGLPEKGRIGNCRSVVL